MIVFASIELWNSASVKYSIGDSHELMQKKAISITDALIKTGGSPNNWTNETVKLIGISEKTVQVLNRKKLAEMKNISYIDLRSIWGISDYEVYLVFKNSTGNAITLDGELLEYGLKQSNQKNLIPFKRLVLINDSGNLISSVMILIIWR
ncbi:hypothetical protein L6303_04835 [archaeon]|nr:hypothetical protein [archaeon]